MLFIKNDLAISFYNLIFGCSVDLTEGNPFVNEMIKLHLNHQMMFSPSFFLPHINQAASFREHLDRKETRCEFLATSFQGDIFPPVFSLLACWFLNGLVENLGNEAFKLLTSQMLQVWL